MGVGWGPKKEQGITVGEHPRNCSDLCWGLILAPAATGKAIFASHNPMPEPRISAMAQSDPTILNLKVVFMWHSKLHADCFGGGVGSTENGPEVQFK